MTETKNDTRRDIILTTYKSADGDVKQALMTLRLEYKIRTTRSAITKAWVEAGYIDPEAKEIVPEDEKLLILRRHNMYRGDPYLAARSMKFPVETIRAVWKEGGLEIRTKTEGEEDF